MENIESLFERLHGNVHIHCFSLDQSPAMVEACYPLLDEGERKRLARLKTETLKNRYTVGRGTLKTLVSKYQEIAPERVRIISGEFGKPYLIEQLGEADLQFSVSNSGHVGVCAFAKGNTLGVDAERVAPMANLEDVMAVSLSEYEKGWFADVAACERERTFYRVWTIKVAYLKAIGTGLSQSLAGVELRPGSEGAFEICRLQRKPVSRDEWSIFEFNPVAGFVGTFVMRGAPLSVKTYQWNAGDFARLVVRATFEVIRAD